MPGQDNFVLYDASDHALCRLNETASALWDLCDGETSIDEMVEAVCLACSVDAGDASKDIARALEQLTGAGVLVWEGGR